MDLIDPIDENSLGILGLCALLLGAPSNMLSGNANCVLVGVLSDSLSES